MHLDAPSITSKKNGSVLEALFEFVDVPDVAGRYCIGRQTWQHRDWIQFSPVKHCQEM